MAGRADVERRAGRAPPRQIAGSRAAAGPDLGPGYPRAGISRGVPPTVSPGAQQRDRCEPRRGGGVGGRFLEAAANDAR